MEGLFITFEGIEGCGKSTQANQLSDFFHSKKIDCVLTHEPGGTQISEKIRKLLLDKKNEGMVPLCELFLYFASRSQHTFEKIKPALKEGKIVISDRFFDSTIAYQGEGRSLLKQKLIEINNFATGGLIPQLTFLIDLPAQTGLKRIKTKDRIEAESIEFHDRVRGAYLTLARENPERMKIIDGTKSIEDIHKEIVNIVLTYI